MYLLVRSLKCSMHKIHVSEMQPEIENVQKLKQKKKTSRNKLIKTEKKQTDKIDISCVG